MPKPTIDRLPRDETFADLDRACTKFLLARDPAFRKGREYFAKHRDAHNARQKQKALSTKH